MRLYLTPDGSASGTYVGIPRRVGAGAIDWTLCYILYHLISIPAGSVALLPWGVLDHVATALALAPVVAYFAWFLASGSTRGMRAVDIQVLVADTGRPPGLGRALGRAFLALLLGAATYVLYFVVFSQDEPAGGYSATDRIVIGASVGLCSLGALAKLWYLVDPRRQTLVDRAFGLVVVEDVAPTAPDPSPWSGLWQPGR